MTEEEFKKAMSKLIIVIVIALVILVIIGIVVFNTFGKQTSIFASEQEKENYKKKVQEVNSHSLTEEEASNLENSSEFQENEPSEGEINEETLENTEEVVTEEQPVE